ncbi:hypothetical protein EN962_11905 [Mesorhizobium sp. M7A.F.Ca.CA.001.09.2.1]|nr:hypothetical protein EN981_14400 [Mesorhizobium sp. M7A.F.Ca.CA.001.13.2.1]RUY78667.1 hypothetical protein EN962_11905 [Mesorhizobium sp. M7A.F.Ca.CA.001.09.2.1]RVA84765.1 hypothetical protein EN914_01955 [Mesorhizobium sp. M7A.F.Ca.CA.001.08.2.1]
MAASISPDDGDVGAEIDGPARRPVFVGAMVLRSDSTAADPIRHAEVNSGPAGLCETSFQACGFSVDKLFTTQDIEVNKTGKFRHH